MSKAMAEADASRHWRRQIDAKGICWLRFDKQGSSTNVLSQDVMTELEIELAAIAADPPVGLVICSAKDSGFIAGADISELEHLEDAAEVEAAAARGQAVCQSVADLPCPTVAAINGFALGGGLELALACDYRVAIRSYERCLGLPEVQLGFNPGFGGTVRSVQLLGAPLALDLMLTGRSVSPVEASKLGLVDRLVDAEDLEPEAAALIALRPPRSGPSIWLKLTNLAFVRPFVARSVRARVRRRAKPEHYPAPFAMIDLWQRYGAHGAAAYAAEAECIGRLMVGPTSKNLVRVYFLRERLKRLAPKDSNVERVHVVGAGVMGGDIASWCALRGLDVSLQDREMRFIEPALKRAKKLFSRRLKGPGEAEAAETRLTADLEGVRV
ncbi:MAG TPA: enoyl-CoA hydratase-related protein, partial [Gammaproteobacteria bacterium]